MRGANGFGIAFAVRAAFAAEDHLADQFFFDDGDRQGHMEGVVDRLLRFGVQGVKEFRLDLFLDGFDGIIAFLFLGDVLGGQNFAAVLFGDGGDQIIGRFVESLPNLGLPEPIDPVSR